MNRNRNSLVLVWGALLLISGGSAPAWAQIAAEPSSFAVAVPQRGEAQRTLSLTNTGSETVSFCISFDRPLQRETHTGTHTGGAEVARLAPSAVGAACGDLGEVLYSVGEDDLGRGWTPYGLAMTPDGRLFAAESGLSRQTHELTPELAILRSFEHPTLAVLSPFASTEGVAHDPAGDAGRGSLWWLNIEANGQDFRRAVLLEGTLDGAETGRRITLPPLIDSDGDAVRPQRLGFDPATERFYFTGGSTGEGSTLWAVDTLGQIIEGYPVRQMARPGAIAVGPDAFGGWNASGGPDGEGAPGEAEAVRLEVLTLEASGDDAVLEVVDVWGGDLGLATPLPVLGPTTFYTGEPLRSRVDPNGVVYVPFVTFGNRGIVGIRAHPLPPSWLTLGRRGGDAWRGTLEAGESAEITLTFSASMRAVGNTYSAVLQVFEAASGEAVEVPLSLEIAPPVSSEDEAAVPEAVSLAVYPNPVRSAATVRFALPEAGAVQLAVYDVLGRRVAVLADGTRPAGEHAVSFDTSGLPSGVYVLRAEVGDQTAAEHLTVLR